MKLQKSSLKIHTYSAEEVLNKLNDRTFIESLITKYPDY